MYLILLHAGGRPTGNKQAPLLLEYKELMDEAEGEGNVIDEERGQGEGSTEHPRADQFLQRIKTDYGHQLTPQHKLDKQNSETFLRQLETYYGNKFLLLQQQGIPAEANNYRHLAETLTEIKHDLDHAALKQLYIYVPTTQ